MSQARDKPVAAADGRPVDPGDRRLGQGVELLQEIGDGQRFLEVLLDRNSG